MPASYSSGANGVPVHSAVPTASSSQGWLTGLGSMRARPLPAHSIVTRRVTARRARRSSSPIRRGRVTWPSMVSRHSAGSRCGMS